MKKNPARNSNFGRQASFQNSIKNKKSIGATAPETVKQTIQVAEKKYL